VNANSAEIMHATRTRLQTHVYSGTPASSLNQKTMCSVSSPGGVMSHGNSAGLPSTTLMFTNGTENRYFIYLDNLFIFS